MSLITELTKPEIETVMVDGRKVIVKKPRSLDELEVGDVVKIPRLYGRMDLARFDGIDNKYPQHGEKAVFLSNFFKSKDEWACLDVTLVEPKNINFLGVKLGLFGDYRFHCYSDKSSKEEFISYLLKLKQSGLAA